MIDAQDLRRTVDLPTLVGRDTRLRKTGANWYAGPCPFCGGVDRFVLKQTSDGWRWLCRHCTDGRYLDAIDYVQRRRGIDFKEAVRQLGGEVSSPLRDDDLPPLAQKPVEPQPQDPETVQRLTAIALEAVRVRLDPNSWIGEVARGYIKRRGLSEDTADLALLGARMVYDPKARRERPAVAISYTNSKFEVTAIKYRFADDCPSGLRYTTGRGGRSGVYHIPEQMGRSNLLMIAEGELNLLSLAQVLPEVDLISTGGQSIGEGTKRTLSALAGRYKRIWCWFDEPQRAAEVARLTGGTPIQSPKVGGTKYDANGLLQIGLLREFLQRLMEAE